MTLKLYYAFLATVFVSALVLDLFLDTAEPVAEQTPAAVEETVFNVDGLTTPPWCTTQPIAPLKSPSPARTKCFFTTSRQ